MKDTIIIHCSATRAGQNITAADIAAAKALHRVIKLLAVVEQNDKDEISVGVYPVMLPETHQLAKVGGSFNAVFVEGEASDDLMFYGRGAGGAPTASAVVGDVVTEARHRVTGTVGPDIPLYSNAPILDAADSTSSYMLRMSVFDKPGVLANAAQVFAKNGVSIKSVQQMEAEAEDGTHELWVITHAVSDRLIRSVVEELEQSVNDIKSVLSVIRVFTE